MRAVVHDRYGPPDVLGLEDVERPVPKDDEVLVKIHATTVTRTAAVCDGASLALACLRKADLSKGRSILIYGASGSVGTAAVQLAKYFDADVTAVSNTKNLELVRSLGATRPSTTCRKTSRRTANGTT